MKVKVEMPFNDKMANKVRKPGEVFECTDARYAEIRKAGRLVSVVKTEKEKEPEKR